MIQSAAIEEIRVRLDETSAGFFRDADLRRFLNEGIRDVARKAQWKRASTTVPAVAGTQTYVLGTDIIQVYRVEFTPTGSSQRISLEYRDLNQMDVVWGINSTSQGMPDYWTMWSANPYTLYLAPVPALAGTITIYYYAMPTDLATNTDTAASSSIDVPLGWEDLPIEYATALGFRKSRRAQDYALAMAAYNEHLQDFLAIVTRGTDSPTMITHDWRSNRWYDPFGFG